MPQLTKKLSLILTAAFILILDQVTKILVVYFIPQGTKAWASGGDFFWLVHQRNPGAAFSFGDSMPDWARVGLFIILTSVVLLILGIYLFREKKLTGFPHWGLWFILAGGIGNLVDRIFRFPDGVVDFLSFNMYGLIGWQRFPSFNVADMAVTIGGGLVILSFFFSGKKKVVESNE